MIKRRLAWSGWKESVRAESPPLGTVVTAIKGEVYAIPPMTGA